MSIIADTYARLQAFRRNQGSQSPSSSGTFSDEQPRRDGMRQQRIPRQVKVWAVSLSIIFGLSASALGIWSQERILNGTKPPTTLSEETVPVSEEEPATQSILAHEKKAPSSHATFVDHLHQGKSKEPSARPQIAQSSGPKKASLASDASPTIRSSVTSTKQAHSLRTKQPEPSSPKLTKNEHEKNESRVITTQKLHPHSILRLEEQRMAKAQNLLRRRLYDEAVTVLTSIFSNPPDTWEPWFLMGTAQLGLGHLEKAEHHFMEGLTRNEAIPQLWVQRAVVDQQRGQYGKATEALQQAAFFAPDHPKVQLNLAYVLELQGHIETAIAHYRRYLSLTEGQPSYFATRRKVIERVAHMERS